MSKEKFIIGMKNTEPAPPEFLYFCGPSSPINCLSACVNEAETVWDTNPDSAHVFRTMEDVATGYDNLMQLFPAQRLFIQARIVSYNTLSTEQFMDIIVQNRINNILGGLDKDDINYLREKGVLDLTIVT